MKFIENFILKIERFSDTFDVDLAKHQDRMDYKYKMMHQREGGELEITKNLITSNGIEYHVAVYNMGEATNPIKVISIQQVDKGLFVGVISAYYEPKNKSVFPLNLPFVDYTKTDSRYRKKGYALSRLQILNTLVQKEWNALLRSDTIVSPRAAKVWQKLAQKEPVKSTNIDNDIIYYFTSAADSSTD